MSRAGFLKALLGAAALAGLGAALIYVAAATLISIVQYSSVAPYVFLYSCIVGLPIGATSGLLSATIAWLCIKSASVDAHHPTALSKRIGMWLGTAELGFLIIVNAIAPQGWALFFVGVGISVLFGFGGYRFAHRRAYREVLPKEDE